MSFAGMEASSESKYDIHASFATLSYAPQAVQVVELLPWFLSVFDHKNEKKTTQTTNYIPKTIQL